MNIHFPTAFSGPGLAFVQAGSTAAQRALLDVPGTAEVGVAIDAALPPGTILMFAGNLPDGFLDCDGSQVYRGTYTALFARIGTNFGLGDGLYTFNLPDLRGRMPLGIGAGPGLLERALGGTGGAETHSLVEAEMPPHQHYYSEPAYPTSNYVGDGGSSYLNAVTSVNSSAYTGSTGSGYAHENMPPFLGVRFIIRY